MQDKGFTLRGLAPALNYDPSYLSKVLNGKKPCTPFIAARLDDILGAGGSIVDAAAPPPGPDGRPLGTAGSLNGPVAAVPDPERVTAIAADAASLVQVTGSARLRKELLALPRQADAWRNTAAGRQLRAIVGSVA